MPVVVAVGLWSESACDVGAEGFSISVGIFGANVGRAMVVSFEHVFARRSVMSKSTRIGWHGASCVMWNLLLTGFECLIGLKSRQTDSRHEKQSSLSFVDKMHRAFRLRYHSGVFAKTREVRVPLRCRHVNK